MLTIFAVRHPNGFRVSSPEFLVHQLFPTSLIAGTRLAAAGEDARNFEEFAVEADEEWPIGHEAGADDGYSGFDLAPHVSGSERYWRHISIMDNHFRRRDGTCKIRGLDIGNLSHAHNTCNASAMIQ